MFMAMLTSAVNLVSMLGSLWLGLYLVTRSPGSRVSWLAALLIWALAALFLRNLLVLEAPGSELLNRLRLLGSLGLPLWFHLTINLEPDRSDRLARARSNRLYSGLALLLAYGAALFVILRQLWIPGDPADPQPPAIYVAGRAVPASGSLIIASTAAVGTVTPANLGLSWARAADRTRRRLFASLLSATVARLRRDCISR